MFNNHIHIKSAHGNYYIYDLLHRSFHISNAINYELAELCRNNNIDITNIQPENKKIFARQMKISVTEINRHIKLLKQHFPISGKKSVEPLYSTPILLKDVWESVANVAQVTIEVTEKCNLACHYCYFRELYATSSPREDNINIEICLKALKTIIKSQKSKLARSTKKKLCISFYGGEGLVNFEAIKKIVEFSEPFISDFYQIKFRMTTNGVLLNQHIDFLVAHDFTINISLDGNENNNSYRTFLNGAPSFPIIYQNICEIRKQYPDYFINNVNFLSVLHDRNDPYSIYSFFNQFRKTPNIESLRTDAVDPKQNTEFQKISVTNPINSDQADEIKEKMPDAFKRFTSELQLMPYLPEIVNTIDLFKDTIEYNKATTETCFLFNTKIFIAVSGEIFLCEKSDRKYPFGKISDKGIQFYVNKINSYYQNIFDQTNKHCLDCYGMQTCKTCFFIQPLKFEKCRECKINYDHFVARLSNLINQNENRK